MSTQKKQSIRWFNFKEFDWKSIISENWFKEMYRVCAEKHITQHHLYYPEWKEMVITGEYAKISLDDIVAYDGKLENRSTDPTHYKFYYGHSYLTNGLFTYPLMKKLYPDVTWYLISDRIHTEMYVTNIPPSEFCNIQEKDILNELTQNVSDGYVIADLVNRWEDEYWHLGNPNPSEEFINSQDCFLCERYGPVNPIEHFKVIIKENVDLYTSSFPTLYHHGKCLDRIEYGKYMKVGDSVSVKLFQDQFKDIKSASAVLQRLLDPNAYKEYPPHLKHIYEKSEIPLVVEPKYISIAQKLLKERDENEKEYIKFAEKSPQFGPSRFKCIEFGEQRIWCNVEDPLKKLTRELEPKFKEMTLTNPQDNLIVDPKYISIAEKLRQSNEVEEKHTSETTIRIHSSSDRVDERLEKYAQRFK